MLQDNPFFAQEILHKFQHLLTIAVKNVFFYPDYLFFAPKPYGKTPAQIGLRWILQKGVAVIPKSTQEERIISNGDIFDFVLEDEDVDAIDQLNRDFRSASLPDDLKDVSF